MSDGPGRWPGTDRQDENGQAQGQGVITGQVWQHAAPPLRTPDRPYEGYVVGPYPYLGADPGPYPYPPPPASPYDSPYRDLAAEPYRERAAEPPGGTAAEPDGSGGAREDPRHEGGGRGGGGRPGRVRPGRFRRFLRLLAALLCALALTGAGTCAWAEFRLDRSVDLGAVADRRPPGKGTNYLIVGSDGRDGLSEQARKELHTGTAGGSRTDSMMLLHTGAHGATMVSLPRDSWVTIPSYVDPNTGKLHRAAKNKLNAAYSLGGPGMLVRTVELNTGLRVDHYAEIGFAGFVGVVDAVGGVDMCVPRNIDDPKSGLKLRKGCHNLTGAQALAFVRQRHQEADGDLGRSTNQRKFLAALARKAAAPGVALDPFSTYPALSAGLDTLVVDKDMELPSLLSLFRAMKSVSGGGGRQLNVPVVKGGFRTAGGSALQWDRAKAEELFAELRGDRPVTTEGEG
ncbi:LytR family transcriptional regulator [Streptomyces sp. D2-8]|uniref:LCP family protein n=1 Tax=Streptomyces sp. D2-8 TaxID=2707767 RepID=UPI0020BEC8A9|nr:LCP family protein [Streptomyces sp. D2-8]MCK8434490.1 LytR family transcriptional regulator [Streptomyces sp. D2-8]